VEKLAEAQRAHAEEKEQRKQAQVEVERLSSANQAQTNQLMQLAMSDGTGAVLPATREDPYYNLILQLQQENSELRQREARAQVTCPPPLAHWFRMSPRDMLPAHFKSSARCSVRPWVPKCWL
jgi:hypothetical protein